MGKLLTLVLGYVLEKFVIKLIAAFGITVVTYVGIDTLVSSSLDKIEPMMGALPNAVLNLMALSGIFEFMSIVASALLTAVAISSARQWVELAK